MARFNFFRSASESAEAVDDSPSLGCSTSSDFSGLAVSALEASHDMDRGLSSSVGSVIGPALAVACAAFFLSMLLSVEHKDGTVSFSSRLLDGLRNVLNSTTVSACDIGLLPLPLVGVMDADGRGAILPGEEANLPPRRDTTPRWLGVDVGVDVVAIFVVAAFAAGDNDDRGSDSSFLIWTASNRTCLPSCSADVDDAGAAALSNFSLRGSPMPSLASAAMYGEAERLLDFLSPSRCVESGGVTVLGIVAVVRIVVAASFLSSWCNPSAPLLLFAVLPCVATGRFLSGVSKSLLSTLALMMVTIDDWR
mmetsp:Transcript_25010/g.70193  ORF Transcript_25010/g.70193 Transcript_25010/m.70193 type:complete len:308 (+) Transcript_25010:2315-3238(+)